MEQTTQPQPAVPPEQPEDEGVPDYADDTSTAYDEADRPRFDDSPPPLPADRPQAVDDFGVTAAEARQGEPMDDRLARERPDVPAGTAGAGDSPVEAAGTAGAGRLVEPDEGARADTEKDAVATGQGAAGGGMTAEEAAMHEIAEESPEIPEEVPDEVPDEQVPVDDAPAAEGPDRG